MRVLVVEDHARLALAIAEVLRREGIASDVSFDGADALAKAAVNRYDVVVLDRDLPGVHGDDVCRELAADGSGRGLLMLTASATIEDRVDGLGIGADDYLPKPFSNAELVARIRALARRSRTALPPVLISGGLRLDPARREVTRAGQPLALTPKEFAVLEVLLAAQGTVVSTEELLASAWDEMGSRRAWSNGAPSFIVVALQRLRVGIGCQVGRELVVGFLPDSVVVAGAVLRGGDESAAGGRPCRDDGCPVHAVRSGRRPGSGCC